MNTQPPRHDFSDQPWLGALPPPNPAMAAFDFWSGQSLQADQLGLSLAVQPRHALAHGALCAAEASLHTNTRPSDPEKAAHLCSWLIETACHEAQDWNA